VTLDAEPCGLTIRYAHAPKLDSAVKLQKYTPSKSRSGKAAAPLPACRRVAVPIEAVWHATSAIKARRVSSGVRGCRMTIDFSARSS